MNGVSGNPDVTRYARLIRIFVIVLGCLAVTWGLAVFPAFWRESPIERTARWIIAGKPYRIEALLGQLSVVDEARNFVYCHPVALRTAAIIRLRLMDEAISAKEQQKIESQIDSLVDSIRSSLSCSPADPFLWLILYWAESTQNGFRPDDIKYLRMSYRLGPNEGWIGLKRNPITFAVSEKISGDLTEYAINEFIGLLKTGFYEQTVQIFTGPAWGMHEQLLLRLQNVSERHRRIFANILYTKGYDVAVPGIERQGSRPWR